MPYTQLRDRMADGPFDAAYRFESGLSRTAAVELAHSGGTQERIAINSR